MRQPSMFSRQRKHGITYYVEIAGTQHNLGTDKAEAFRKYGALLAEDRPGTAAKMLVVDLIDQFLKHLKKTAKAEATYTWYRKHLDDPKRGFKGWLVDHFKGRLNVADLSPQHVDDWLLDRYKQSGDNHKIGGIRSISRACNWARKRKLITSNPVADVERPKATPRKHAYLEPASWLKLEAAIGPGPFLDIVQFLKLTGARPHESCIAEVRHFDRANHCLVFPVDESKGKEVERVIQLGTGEAFEIVQRLALAAGEGPIFRRKGKAWTNDALNREFDLVEKVLGFKVFPYQLRHSWITDALIKGIDPVTIAALSGHRDLSMIQRVYSHLKLKGTHLRDTMDRINGAA